jgi:hypothetical protein
MQREYYIGSFGPFIYEDTETYPDGTSLVGYRGPTAKFDDPPVDPEDGVRLTDLTSTIALAQEEAVILSIMGL